VHKTGSPSVPLPHRDVFIVVIILLFVHDALFLSFRGASQTTITTYIVSTRCRSSIRVYGRTTKWLLLLRAKVVYSVIDERFYRFRRTSLSIFEYALRMVYASYLPYLFPLARRIHTNRVRFSTSWRPHARNATQYYYYSWHRSRREKTELVIYHYRGIPVFENSDLTTAALERCCVLPPLLSI